MRVKVPVAADREAAREALVRCGAFTADEVRVAIEMFDEGLAGDYVLVGVEVDEVLRAYACIGKAWLTESSWYLYWICVHPAFQRRGVGRLLQRAVEEHLRREGGRRLVLETSGRSAYEASRCFYTGVGFELSGRIPDFYRRGDDCLLYVKALGEAA